MLGLLRYWWMSEQWAGTLCSKFPLHKHFGKYLFNCDFKKLIVLKFCEAWIGFMALTEELHNTIWFLASSEPKNHFPSSWLITKKPVLDLSLVGPPELYPFSLRNSRNSSLHTIQLCVFMTMLLQGTSSERLNLCFPSSLPTQEYNKLFLWVPFL